MCVCALPNLLTRDTIPVSCHVVLCRAADRVATALLSLQVEVDQAATVVAVRVTPRQDCCFRLNDYKITVDGAVCVPCFP